MQKMTGKAYIIHYILVSRIQSHDPNSQDNLKNVGEWLDIW